MFFSRPIVGQSQIWLQQMNYGRHFAGETFLMLNAGQVGDHENIKVCGWGSVARCWSPFSLLVVSMAKYIIYLYLGFSCMGFVYLRDWSWCKSTFLLSNFFLWEYVTEGLFYKLTKFDRNTVVRWVGVRGGYMIVNVWLHAMVFVFCKAFCLYLLMLCNQIIT